MTDIVLSIFLAGACPLLNGFAWVGARTFALTDSDSLCDGGYHLFIGVKPPSIFDVVFH
jgi:hypothetical protein